jgi:hypothetical protein
MSKERGYSRTTTALLCLLVAPVIMTALTFAAVYVENLALGTHHVEDALTELHVDAPFRWAARHTRIGP